MVERYRVTLVVQRECEATDAESAAKATAARVLSGQFPLAVHVESTAEEGLESFEITPEPGGVIWGSVE